MYRIRLATGEEAAFRTVEELALAVRSGVVSPKAEVFHNAANRWLPVEVHPDYKAAASGKRPALPVDRKQATPAPRSAITDKTPVATSAPSPVAPRVAPRVAPPAAPAARRASGATPPRGRRTLLAWATAAAAMFLFGGAAFLAVPRLRAWAALGLSRPAALEEGMAALPPGITQFPARDASPPSAAGAPRESSLVAPDDLLGPPPEPAPSPTDADSTIRVTSLRASRTSGVSYPEAYAEARAEMDESLRYVQFRRVFNPARFSSADSIRAARRMLSAAGNILRAYRGREVMLEQIYRPDDPGGRGTLREPFETAETSRALLADADSLFGLLIAQQGRFRFDGTRLQFTDPRAARHYSDLRRRIMLTLGDWRHSPDLNSGVTVPRLVLALGAEAPPPAH